MSEFKVGYIVVIAEDSPALLPSGTTAEVVAVKSAGYLDSSITLSIPGKDATEDWHPSHWRLETPLEVIKKRLDRLY